MRGEPSSSPECLEKERLGKLAVMRRELDSERLQDSRYRGDGLRIVAGPNSDRSRAAILAALTEGR
jgi:hypothetical protein